MITDAQRSPPPADADAASADCRYGSPPAQFKAFWDATGGLWLKGALVGKAVTAFVGTAAQGSGQETTHLVCECAIPVLLATCFEVVDSAYCVVHYGF